MVIPTKFGGRRLLLAGFGGLILLMLVAGIDAVVILHQIRTSDTEERNLYLRRATALDWVRTGIYQSAIVLRAYLLADNASQAATQLEQWRQAKNSTEQALRECATVLDRSDTPQMQALKSEIEDYWRLLDFLTTIPEKDR